jgi:protein-L-isoaspartate(D-aspartate) O-methyltransferase
MQTGSNMNAANEHMIYHQLQRRGIADERVLDAFRTVPREYFVPYERASMAYADSALPIGEGQTISQPYVVARTLQALALVGNELVLEVGTGSGYVTALLSKLAREVYSIERIPSLAATARSRLQRYGYSAHVLCGDGTLGWPEHAPYDAIAVAASGPVIPPALVAQLSRQGRMVLPVGQERTQKLLRVARGPADDLLVEELDEVRFVPLIGAQGASEPPLLGRADAGTDHFQRPRRLAGSPGRSAPRGWRLG